MPANGIEGADSDSRLRSPVNRLPPLLCVVEDDSQSVARAAVHPADPVPEVDAIVAARAFHRPVAGRKENRLSAIGEDHLRLGLRSRLLFDQNEFSAFPVAVALPERENHLQRKADIAVEILMQTVVSAGFVMEHQRRWLCLPGLVAEL